MPFRTVALKYRVPQTGIHNEIWNFQAPAKHLQDALREASQVRGFFEDEGDKHLGCSRCVCVCFFFFFFFFFFFRLGVSKIKLPFLDVPHEKDCRKRRHVYNKCPKGFK